MYEHCSAGVGLYYGHCWHRLTTELEDGASAFQLHTVRQRLEMESRNPHLSPRSAHQRLNGNRRAGTITTIHSLRFSKAEHKSELEQISKHGTKYVSCGSEYPLVIIVACQARAQLPSDIPAPVPEHRAIRGDLDLSPVHPALRGDHLDEPEPLQLVPCPYWLTYEMRRGGPL
jgi:hypothetical protein